MGKIKIVALFGPSSCGKDTVKKSILKNTMWHDIIPTTTRPMRENETQGKEYHFVSNEEFTHQVLDGSMIEATCFKDWFYGTNIKDISETGINIGIFNPEGLEIVLSNAQFNVLPVFIKVDAKTRLLRSINREGNPDYTEICRRFLADEQDFAKIDFPKDTKTFIFENNETHNDLSDFYTGKPIVDFVYQCWAN